ncbi:MAG: hypothetical protein JXR48_01295 [Candidatus Delongbacteria bacterium]|nr:hypothetical protein [Candidatus Delongbacteria bacterium]MBN2833579.1 hypothetical protein [Candidatus Delongbacteria bacterium]
MQNDTKEKIKYYTFIVVVLAILIIDLAKNGKLDYGVQTILFFGLGLTLVGKTSLKKPQAKYNKLIVSILIILLLLGIILSFTM